MRRSALLAAVLACVLYACGGLRSRFEPDGGTALEDGGADAAVPEDAGDAAVPQRDGGTQDAGPADAGGGDGGGDGWAPDAAYVFTGDGGPLKWTYIPVPLGVRKLEGVAAGAGQIWAVGTGTAGDYLLRAGMDGGFVATLVSFTGASERIHVTPGGGVALLGRNHLAWCAGGSSCSQQGHYIEQQAPFPLFMRGLCGLGERVFAVGYDNDYRWGVVFERTGNTWTQRVADAGVEELQACALTPSGRLFAVGLRDVFRLDPDGGTGVEHIPVNNGASLQLWRRVLGDESLLVVAGDLSRVFHRGRDGGYEQAQDGYPTGSPVNGLAGQPGHELFAGGPSFDFRTTSFSTWYGGSWRFLNPIWQWGELEDMVRVDDNFYVAVGYELNSGGGQLGGLIMFGRR